MRKSLFFRQLLGLVALALLLMALLITGFSMYSLRSIYLDSRSKELLPQAQRLANYVGRFFDGAITINELEWAVRGNPLLETPLYIYTADGSLMAYSTVAQGGQPPNSTDIQTVLDGEKINRISDIQVNGSSFVVGVPVTGESEAIQGAVFLIQPIKELDDVLKSLYRAILWSIMGVFVFMLCLTIFFARRMVKPLHQMSDVALRMAEGRFDLRAADGSRGEIGQLGRSLNHLSDRLSTTISALTLERNRLTRVLDGLSEGILAVDAQGQITHVNPALRALFGHAPWETFEDRAQLFHEPAIWAAVDATIAGHQEQELQIPEAGRMLNVHLSPIDDEDGHIAGAVGLLRDVTELEHLEQTRRDYVANVSHELRTPVSALRGMAEALNDGMIQSPADQKRYYGYILRESMRLGRLINDLLELSRLQSGSVALDRGRVDMKELLGDLSARYAAMVDDVGLEFQLDLPAAEAYPPALTNPDRIQQVLVILLDNAIKFTQEGGITVTARWDEREYTLSVRDTGTGISTSDLPHVFERFYKADSAHSGQGTGLGLSIAQEIITALGERIWVESQPGWGTRFSFTVALYPKQNQIEEKG